MSILIKQFDYLTIKIDEKILPFIVQDLIHLIGWEATMTLVDHYKGTSIWVPRNYTPDHVLVKLIGHAAALKLIETYGGERFDMPKCDDAMRAVRNFKICESDKSQAQLAREYNLTVRQIRNIQCDIEDDRQEGLF